MRNAGILPWAAWIAAALFFFYGFLLRVSPSVMVGELMRDFAVGAAILGNLSAVYFYLYASLQVPVGLLYDRFGTRRLLTVATLFCAGGAALFAAAPTLEIAYLGRALIGAGAAFSFVGAATIAARDLPARHYATLVGTLQLIGMLGAFGGQGPMALTVDALGWRGAMFAATTLGVALALALWLLVRDPPRVAQAGGLPLLAGLKMVLRNPQSWLIALYGAAATAPMLSFAGLWGVPWLVQVHGFDRPTAASATSMVFLGLGFGSLTFGILSDRLGRRKPVMAVTMSVATILYAFVVFGPALGPAGYHVVLFFGGFFLGGLACSYPLGREVNDPRATGASLGFVNMAVTGSGAVFQPLLGLLLDLNWQGAEVAGVRLYDGAAWTMALGVLPVFCLVGLIGVLFIREPRRG
jgi:MFS family permease